MLKILIADKLSPEGAAALRTQPDVQVEVKTGLKGAELATALHAADGVVVRSEVQVTGEVIEAAMVSGGRLRAIARAGVGVDNIDLAAATRHGVAVMNSASASTVTTAEHAFALMIALARNIAPAHMTMAAGGWDRQKFTGMQLHGRTLGVVGFGRIGQTLAHRALAFGMKVLAYDPMVNAETAMEGAVRLTRTFDELVENVDVVSFHVPKTVRTTGMLGAQQFARCRKGLLVVNAARGGVVDEAFLLAALESGQCGGAAIDVFTEEPPPADSPLRKHPKILCTPHLGASTVEAQEAVAVEACLSLLSYLRGQGVEGAVNTGGLKLDLTDRQRRFSDLAASMVGLLQAALSQKDREGMKAVKVSLRGESIAGRAETIARTALAELLRMHLAAPVNLINAPVIAEERGIDVKTEVVSDKGDDRVAVEVVDGRGTPHRVEGAIYADGLPRVTSLDGYAMDMVVQGHLVLVANADRPGRIGLVGRHFGEAGVNIAEMVIGRRTGPEGVTAMMVIKLDEPAREEVLESLRKQEGILHVAAVGK